MTIGGLSDALGYLTFELDLIQPRSSFQRRSTMVSKAGIVCNVALAVAFTIYSAQALEVGDFYRPNSSECSAVVGTTATYRRSPCPALNTLANHGYIPRNGMGITPTILKNAVMEVFNIGSDLAAALVSGVPVSTTLDFLSTHNFIEHDASMVHADIYYGADPMNTDIDLVNDLLGRADSSGQISVSAVAAVRKDRLASCLSNNPTCSFGVTQSTIAYGESCTLLLGFGAKASDSSISVAHATSFLVDERIPDDFVKASSAVTLWDVSVLSATLQFKSLFFAF